jgi:hypothetical protein
MWILPKQLHTSDFVPDTEALSLDLNESSQLCAQSLFVRSKLLPLRTWLQKWKRDSWTQHLFGRILKPSLGQSFLTAWTSSLEATHASHSAPQVNASELKTHVTFGPTLQPGFDLCDQKSASLKTSKDTLRWDSLASLATWKSWVTKCRGEYLARLSLVRLTRESGCLSWPTVQTTDLQGACLTEKRLSRPKGTQLREKILMWPTCQARDWKDTAGTSLERERPQGGARGTNGILPLAVYAETHGQAGPENHSTHGSRPESWLTPRANEPTKDSNFVERMGDRGDHCSGSLSQQVSRPESWATLQASDHVEGRRTDLDSNQKCLGRDLKAQGASGKLNPRWVETLMGLPVGWTMPSCASPVTIALTSCACSETELCQPPQH